MIGVFLKKTLLSMISVDNANNIFKRKLRIWSFSFLGLIGILPFNSCTEEKHKHFPQLRYEIMGEAQGTTYNIVYFTDETVIAKSAIDSILDAIDLAASIWVESSIISRFNNSSDSIFEVPVGSRFFTDNFSLSKEVYNNTNGAYNPTVGELVNAWGFGFKNREKMDSIKVDSLLQSVGFSESEMNLVLSNGSTFIKKLNPNTQLDFNGIAQGYSVDVLAEYFKSQGIFNYMIEVGGELLANGRKSNGSYWKIGIDKPVDSNLKRVLAATLKLDNISVATSGNYRKFYESDGIRYAHTIDPKTGFPVQHSLLSATVVMQNCGLADAYATSFMVMGTEKAIEFIETKPELGIEVYLIYSDENGGMQTYFSDGLEDMLEEL